MLRLDSTTRKLQALLAGAITSANLPVVSNWADKTATAYTGGCTVINTNGVTAVDIVAAPSASTVRDVDTIVIRNADTASATVTVRYNDNGTTYDVAKVTLQVGDQLCYTHGTGWFVLDALGVRKNGDSISSLGSAAYLDAGSVVLSGPTRTITSSTDTISSSDVWLRCNNAGTVTLTLPSAATYPGRIIGVRTITANTVVSASSNVKPIDTDTAGTAILAATAGKWAVLVSDGTNWQIQMAG